MTAGRTPTAFAAMSGLGPGGVDGPAEAREGGAGHQPLVDAGQGADPKPTVREHTSESVGLGDNLHPSRVARQARCLPSSLLVTPGPR